MKRIFGAIFSVFRRVFSLTAKKIGLLVFGLIVLVAAGTPAYYFYNQYQRAKSLLDNPTQAAQEEVQDLTAKVGKLIALPNEKPTVATVVDADKLKAQPFFAYAENGDKILIYQVASKAILYRPRLNKVIEVAPVNLGDSKQPVQTVKIRIYNGTGIPDVAKKYQAEMSVNLNNIEIIGLDNTKGKDYQKTLVIDLTGNKPELAKQLNEIIHGEVASLPSAETKPDDGDLLVIIGRDYLTKSPFPTATPSAMPTQSVTTSPTASPTAEKK